VLRRLIEAVARGGAGDTRELAAELGASHAVVEAMMDELARRGFVERASECLPSCGDCPASGICASRGSGGIWIVTRAGREMAAY
jgi:hypothetical protein